MLAQGGKTLFLLLTLPLISCGREPDLMVHGAAIEVESNAPFTQRPDFPIRMEETLSAALTYWGGTWKDLENKAIILQDSQHVPCGKSTDAIGCHDGSIRISTRDPSIGTWHCIEETVLVHEVGHAVIGDPNHTDPRWMDFVSLLRKLDGRPGYGADRAEPCQPYLSVWRHVLATR